MQAECQVPDFVPGPMALIIDSIIDAELGYSPLSACPDSYIYLSERRLQQRAAERKQNKRNVALTGKKRAQETGYYHVNAWLLGEEALRLQDAAGDTAIAVLFRDSDGTRSTAAGLWEAKVDSVASGFDRSGLGVRGVPMIPKPKSEAWLLCAARTPAYVNCGALEDRSGNDQSPQSLKNELAGALQGQTSAVAQSQWLAANGFDSAAVAGQMPSFGAFSHALRAALAA
jgi:hypothetical protein